MLTPKQTKIFGAFLGQPYKERTYREIKEYSKEKSNSVTQKAISKFLAEGIILQRKVGNVFLYRANLENTAVHDYFGILIKEQLKEPVKICLQIIKEAVSQIIFVSLAIFGSYAENKHTEKSDLDIVALVNTDKDKRQCELALKEAELKCIIPIDAHVFTKDKMLEMLKDKDENLGKQIAEKHLAVNNPEILYSTINEGIANGFQIIH